jgi:diadenosine tetraphosphate (Ap4A) HIT family hydrolase
VAYDSGNVFARILRGEIPCKKVYEDEHVLAFHDINPQTAVHVLVIPKGAYADIDEFAANATDAEIAGFVRGVGRTARTLSLETDGYRALSNCGRNARQEVPHLHVHLFGGQDVGPMIDATARKKK